MAIWTTGALEYLESHLSRLEQRQAGPFSSAEREALRQRIVQSVESAVHTEGITREHLLQALVEMEVAAPVPPPAGDVPAPPPLPPQQVRVLSGPRKFPAAPASSGFSQGCVIALILGAVALGLVMITGLLAAMLLPALARGREAARRASCQNNLKQIGLIARMYAEENSKFPSLSPDRGTLMMSAQQVYPEFATDPGIFVCPSSGIEGEGAEQIDDDSYVYFSHALPDEDSGLAFVEAYKTKTLDALDEDLQVNLPGSGPDAYSPETLHRLTNTTAANMTEQGMDMDPAELPLVLEWTGVHIPDGNNVLYLDGHVEYLEHYVDEFPNSETFIEALWSIDR